MQYMGNKKYENYKTWDSSGTSKYFQVLSLHSRPAPQSLFPSPLSPLFLRPFLRARKNLI